jgi:hypothetical protein
VTITAIVVQKLFHSMRSHVVKVRQSIRPFQGISNTQNSPPCSLFNLKKSDKEDDASTESNRGITTGTWWHCSVY